MIILKRILPLVLIFTMISSAVYGSSIVRDTSDALRRGDYVTVIKIARPQAEMGDRDAQFIMGIMYDEGKGVNQNYKEAIKWYQKAANQGHASAQYNLGVMYYEGFGLSQNSKEAVKWYRLAANQGLAIAQLNLAAMYAIGAGTAQDFVTAYKWASLAAKNGHEKGNAVRDEIAKHMTTEQISKGQAMVRRFRPN